MHHSGFIVDVLLSSVRPKSGESLTACQPLRPLRPCHQNPGGENFQGFPHCLDLGLISRGGETFNGGKLTGSYSTRARTLKQHPPSLPHIFKRLRTFSKHFHHTCLRHMPLITLSKQELFRMVAVLCRKSATPAPPPPTPQAPSAFH